MTFEEMLAVVIPVALAMRAEFDGPTQRAYYRVLRDVAPGLLESALEGLGPSGATFLWTAPEMLHACERRRRQMLALHPWEPCAECEDFPGYRKVMTGGVQQETREKCPCKARHKARLAEYGLATPLAELPAEAWAGDEKVYPTVDKLPETLRKQVEQVAARKQLR